MVVNAATGEPVSKAMITLQGSLSGSQVNAEAMAKVATYTVSASGSGEFEFKDVDPGTYRLSASRRGFVDASQRGLNNSTPLSSVVRVAAGQDVRSVKLRLTPQAVITGRVTDSDGEPFQGVQVIAMRRYFVQGNSTVAVVSAAVTNDLGEYRITELAPGRYFLLARYRQAEHSNLGPTRQLTKDEIQETYPVTYYPGVTAATNALPVEVGAGAIRQGIDVSVGKTSAHRIRGRVVLPAGSPLSRTFLSLASAQPSESMGLFNSGQTTTQPDGSFEFNYIVPGSYFLQGSDLSGFIKVPLEVGDHDIDGIRAAPQPFLTLVGRLQWDGDPPTEPPKMRVHFAPALPPGQFFETEGTAAFKLGNFSPDRMRISVTGMSNQDYVKTIRYGNQTVEDEVIEIAEGAELEVVMKRGAASVEGTTESAEGPFANATVLLIPTAESRRTAYSLFRQTTADQTGHFSFEGLAPGEYLLIAFDQIEPGSWFEPDFLSRFERGGERIKLEEKGHDSKKLTVIR